MTSRERVRKALNHEKPDKVPHDLGATTVTGIAASTYHALREKLRFGKGKVKIWEPFQMLGEVESEAREVLGIDTIGLSLPNTFFGFKNNQGWKPWRLFEGIEVLVPVHFMTTSDEQGNYFIYPQGDTSAPPSGKMPKDGYYFDILVRQDPIEDLDILDPEDWIKGMYPLFNEEELLYLEKTSKNLFENTNFSLVGNLINAGFGDMAWLPAPHLKYPEGIRDPEEWIMAHLTHPDYIQSIYEKQAEIAIKNLEMAYEAVGERLDVLMVSGTDFGTQNGLMWSPDIYRELYKPFHMLVNRWVHEHTPWKVFFHTCGSIVKLMDEFIEVGVDILNPVQGSAAGMDLGFLKEKYGDKVTFWGGGVDTQKTLPFGSPEEVEEEVRERIEILGKDGGFVFATVHNIQAGVPIENLLAMYRSLEKNR
jgi:uroporphyrinogen-III decarboxylase